MQDDIKLVTLSIPILLLIMWNIFKVEVGFLSQTSFGVHQEDPEFLLIILHIDNDVSDRTTCGRRE
jgi:hypothetical protein